MSVTKLKHYKITVYVAGYEICTLIDTGSTIYVINSDNETDNESGYTKCDRQCVVANGSNINLDTIVSVPAKICKVIFMAELYVLNVELYIYIYIYMYNGIHMIYYKIHYNNMYASGLVILYNTSCCSTGKLIWFGP